MMQNTPLFQKLLLGFAATWVGMAGVHGTDLGTMGRPEGTDAFGTFARINDVNGIILKYRLIRTLRFSGSAAYAFVVDVISHFLSSLTT